MSDTLESVLIKCCTKEKRFVNAVWVSSTCIDAKFTTKFGSKSSKKLASLNAMGICLEVISTRISFFSKQKWKCDYGLCKSLQEGDKKFYVAENCISEAGVMWFRQDDVNFETTQKRILHKLKINQKLIEK